MNGIYDSGFNQSDWYALRNALLAIEHHNGEGECKDFEALSIELKSSSIGIYLQQALIERNQNAFQKAAELLVPEEKNRWLAIWKS